VKTEKGEKVPFRLNVAQWALLDDLHYLNIILKARQLGFTTFIQIFILDACLFNSNTSAGVIADTLPNAKRFLKDIIKFAYDNLPDWLRAERSLSKDSTEEIEFSNGSSIRVGASLRSGTYQYLHISEYGKICARNPDKAKEIKTGALNTIHEGALAWIESTAEGQSGEFHDMTSDAQKKADAGKVLTPLEFKFHFFPWWKHPNYRMDPTHVIVTAEHEKYFADLRKKHGIELDDEQKAWFVLKKETQKDDMGKEFPSTPGEAFAASIEGAYYKTEMSRVRRDRRICRIPFEPTVPVNTFWDLGMNDDMTIWLHQRVSKENRFIGYYENSGEGLAHYAYWLDNWAKDREARFAKHHMPHDVEVRELGSGKTRKVTAESLGIKPIVVVPRIENILDGIQMVRNVLPSCWFDEVECAEGVKHLDSFRREWDEKHGVPKNTPRHDAASHGEASFRQFAQGYDHGAKEPTPDWLKRQQSGNGRGSWMAR